MLFSFKQFVETIPLCSVECERIFSQKNFIKDKSKNALTTRNLFYRIDLKVHGESVDRFDYDSAFEIWKANKTRRM